MIDTKRIGIAVAAVGWASAAQAAPAGAGLVPPAMALPAPPGLLDSLLVLTFFAHLVLVNILLGSVLLAILDRRGAASDTPGGVAFLPKTLALAVNFGIAPFLFLQVLYGHFLYPGIVLMAVWWLAVVLFVMLGYYGLYVSDGAVNPARRTPVLILTALLLLMTAFLLTNASTLMLRPALWFQWFSEPHGTILNLRDATLFPRYLHIILASLAVGGLTMAWRARWSARRTGAGPAGDSGSDSGADGAGRRFRRGLDWFFFVSLAQVPVGVLFLFSLPPEVRALFLGGSVLHTAALPLVLSGLLLALFTARRGELGRTTAAALGIVLVMVCVRDMVRAAMLSPYAEAPSAAPNALAMPHGQTAALTLFLVCAVCVAAVLVWLARVLRKVNRCGGSGMEE